MAHTYQTNQYEGMIAETVTLKGHNGDVIHAYFARPLGAGPFPGMVLIHHMPGWDEWYRECTRALRPPRLRGDLPEPLLPRRPRHPRGRRRQGARGGRRPGRPGGRRPGRRERLAALAAVRNGKVGIFGTCSGGRQAFLAACRLKGFDAAVECWGGRVVMAKEELTPSQPVAPIDYTKDLSCPLLGLFGNEDKSPTPEQVNQHEEELKKHGKDVRVPPLRRRRPRLLLLRPARLPAGAGHGRLEEGLRVLREDPALTRDEEPSHVHDDRPPGEARGPRQEGPEWFEVREANVSYDHPYDLPLEHALNIDFVNEALGPGARVAVELSVEAARQLVKTIQAVLAQADQRGVLEDVPVAATRAGGVRVA